MASLKDVCFKQVSEQYWYGLFGDFKLIIDRETGYFNATKLCQDGGRRFHKWLENKQAKDLLESCKSDHPNSPAARYTIEGNKNKIYNEIISGTYVHEDLILNIACWVSSDFYWKCVKIVKEYFIHEFKTKYLADNQALTLKLQEIDVKLREIKVRNEKLEGYVEDISPKTEDTAKHNKFAIVQKSNSNDTYPWKILRIQKRNVKQALRKIKTKYPKSVVVAEAEYNPNAVNFMNRIVENIPYVSRYYSNICLNGIPIELFVRDINKLLEL